MSQWATVASIASVVAAISLALLIGAHVPEAIDSDIDEPISAPVPFVVAIIPEADGLYIEYRFAGLRTDGAVRATALCQRIVCHPSRVRVRASSRAPAAQPAVALAPERNVAGLGEKPLPRRQCAQHRVEALPSHRRRSHHGYAGNWVGTRVQVEAVSHAIAVWRKTDGDTEQRHEHHVIAARKLLIELTEQFVEGLSESTLGGAHSDSDGQKAIEPENERPPTLA